MKAMILAAGRGERMRPLTLERPKPLLNAGGRTLLDWNLLRLAEAGVREAVINVSWFGAQIIEHCGDEHLGVRVTYSREEEPLETAGGIIQALPMLGPRPFIVVNADIWLNYDYRELLRRKLQPAAAHLVFVDNPEHHPAGDFSLEDGRVHARGAASLTYAGLGLYDPGFFAGYAPGRRPLLPLFERAIRETRLTGERFPGLWTDVGTPERLRQLDARLSADFPG
ncbi:MAG: N-acetylmuramate alpha-1-phosphate uridylyltransferase MurU [Pseudomonadota bacterium]